MSYVTEIEKDDTKRPFEKKGKKERKKEGSMWYAWCWVSCRLTGNACYVSIMRNMSTSSTVYILAARFWHQPTSRQGIDRRCNIGRCRRGMCGERRRVRMVLAREGEQGNRGTGEQGSLLTSALYFHPVVRVKSAITARLWGLSTTILGPAGV